MPSATATRKTRTYEYETHTLDLSAAMTMSGLEYMQALVSGKIGAEPSIGVTMGMSIPQEIAEGFCVFEAEPSDFVLNPLGTVHGGFAATVLDSALGCAIHTGLPAGYGYTTAELKVNYTRAIRPDSGRLRAEGRVIHMGRQMATSEAKLMGIEDGKLYAHGSTTCFVFPFKKA